MKIHKKFPRGTEISSGRDELSIWAGDVMAKVEGGGYDNAGPTFFDAENIARRVLVYPSNIAADPRLLGRQYHLKYGDKAYWDQLFYFKYGGEWNTSAGQFEQPFDYWVEIKLSHLGTHQNYAVLAVLRDKKYVEVDGLSASKWRKLLGMSFEETQDEPAKEANAAYHAVERLAGYRSAPTMEGDERIWASIPGIYGVTKKGGLKFIISRKANKQGL
jgi:hypothetical protein